MTNLEIVLFYKNKDFFFLFSLLTLVFKTESQQFHRWIDGDDGQTSTLLKIFGMWRRGVYTAITPPRLPPPPPIINTRSWQHRCESGWNNIKVNARRNQSSNQSPQNIEERCILERPKTKVKLDGFSDFTRRLAEVSFFFFFFF